jgi:hypothetical protein
VPGIDKLPVCRVVESPRSRVHDQRDQVVANGEYDEWQKYPREQRVQEYEPCLADQQRAEADE